LEAVQSGTTVSDLVDVLPHDSDGIVDLLKKTHVIIISESTQY